MQTSTKPNLKIGDNVKVKKGTDDGYIGKYDISGYEGRIFDIYQTLGDWLVEVEFDSITISQLPGSYIKDYIREEIDYAIKDFQPNELELSEPRDTIADVKAAREEIRKKYGFISILDKERKPRPMLKLKTELLSFTPDPDMIFSGVATAITEKYLRDAEKRRNKQ